MHFPARFPALATPRLRLRGFQLSDAAAVQPLAGAREVATTTALIPHPYPDGAAEAWIATHAAAWAEHRELVLASTLRSTGALVGAIGLVFNTPQVRAEMGYWVGLPYWNRGYATEAGIALLGFAFGEMDLQRVQAFHFTRNPASGRAMLKMGLQREGESPAAFQKDGQFEDLVFYGAIRDQWLSRFAP